MIIKHNDILNLPDLQKCFKCKWKSAWVESPQIDFSGNGICVKREPEFGILKQNVSEIRGWNYVWVAEYRKQPSGLRDYPA